MNSGKAKIWLKWSRLGFMLVVVLWLGWILINADVHSDMPPSLWIQWQSWLFFLCWLLLPVGLGILWWCGLRLSFDVVLPVSKALQVQGLAWGGRYLPGKAGILLAKISIAGEYGAKVRSLSHSVLVEQGLFVLSGVVVGVAFLPWSVVLEAVYWDHSFWNWLQQNMDFDNLLPAQILLASGMTLAGFFGLLIVCRLFGVEYLRRDILLWILIYAGYCTIHILLGLALYPLIASMAADSAMLLGVGGVVAALALANSLGILAIFAPAGLGVREVVLAAILAVALSYSASLGIAAFLRVLTLVADVVFTLLAWSFGLLIDWRSRASASYRETSRQ